MPKKLASQEPRVLRCRGPSRCHRCTSLQATRLQALQHQVLQPLETLGSPQKGTLLKLQEKCRCCLEKLEKPHCSCCSCRSPKACQSCQTQSSQGTQGSPHSCPYR